MHAHTHTNDKDKLQTYQDKFNRHLTTPKHTTTSSVHPSHSPLPWVSQSRTSFVSHDYVPCPFPFLAPFLAPCPDLGPGDLGPCPYPARSPACPCLAHGPGLCGLVDPGPCPDPFHDLSLSILFVLWFDERWVFSNFSVDTKKNTLQQCEKLWHGLKLSVLSHKQEKCFKQFQWKWKPSRVTLVVPPTLTGSIRWVTRNTYEDWCTQEKLNQAEHVLIHLQCGQIAFYKFSIITIIILLLTFFFFKSWIQDFHFCLENFFFC